MEIHQEFRDLRVVSVRVEIVHPLEIFFRAALVSGLADAVQLAALPVGKVRPDLFGGVLQLRPGIEFGVAAVNHNARLKAPGLPGRRAKMLQRVDDDHTLGLDTLHDELHDVFRQGYAAARIGL